MNSPTLFIIPGACSFGAQILLETLHVPYKICVTTAEIRQSERFKTINTAGKVGALKDNDFIVVENTAILLYLAEKYADMTQKSLQAKGKIYQYLSYLSTTVHPAFSQFNYPERFVEPHATSDFKTLAYKRLITMLNNVECIFSKHNLFPDKDSDEISVVDMQGYALLRWIRKLEIKYDFPNINQFLTVMESNKHVINALYVEEQRIQLLTESLFDSYFVI